MLNYDSGLVSLKKLGFPLQSSTRNAQMGANYTERKKVISLKRNTNLLDTSKHSLNRSNIEMAEMNLANMRSLKKGNQSGLFEFSTIGSRKTSTLLEKLIAKSQQEE